MRLIDADALLETGSGVKMIIPKNCHPYEAIKIQGKAFREAVETAPTIDAAPVVHGRWVGVPITKGVGACPYFNGNVGDNRHNCVGAPFSCPCKRSSIWGKSTYHCSECGLKVGYSEKAKTNYCPNCGAKMEGERKDNGC